VHAWMTSPPTASEAEVLGVQRGRLLAEALGAPRPGHRDRSLHLGVVMGRRDIQSFRRCLVYFVWDHYNERYYKAATGRAHEL
jgi:hypothetical protein